MGKADHRWLLGIIEHVCLAQQDIEHLIYQPKKAEDSGYGSFPVFFRSLQKEMLLSKTATYPINLDAFLQLLKTPISEWGFFNMRELQKRKIPSDIRILNDYSGVTMEAYLLLQEFDSYQELTTEPVVSCLTYCLQKLKQGECQAEDWYRLFRTYLIDHPIVDMQEVELFGVLSLNNDRELIRLLKSCYQEIPASQFSYQCPHCGWTIEEVVKGTYRCLSEDCYRYFDEERMRDRPLPKEKSYRTVREIQRTTVIPGIRELELRDKLREKGIESSLYPAIEMGGDLRIVLRSNQVIEVDVKNYSQPYALAERLVSDYREGRNKTSYIAIPDDKAKKTYLSAVRICLEEEGIDYYNLLSFKEVVRMATRKDEKIRV